MDSNALFGLSILMSVPAFGIVTTMFVWPRVRVMRGPDALIPLLIPHTFRFLGLSFLIPGVVSPSLSPAFAVPAAYGDLVAAVLADIAILALAARVSWAIPIVWVFNVWGSIDLLHAIYQGQIRLGIDPDPWERRFSSRRRRPAVPRFTWRHFLAAIAARTRWPSVPTGQLRGCL